MTTRLLAWIAVAVSVVVLLCSGLVGVLVTGGSAAAGCAMRPNTAATTANAAVTAAVGGHAPIGRWNGDQVANAVTIMSVGARMGVPPRGWVIAVATAMQESSLRNLPGGDRDSVGLFQQRPSQGWGSLEQLRDPQYAAGRFYARLLTIDGWQGMTLTDAAQAVQISGRPNAYARWEPDAVALVETLTGVTAAPNGCGVTVSAEGWTQPVRARVGSGFRTADRPSHDGVDLSVPKGTPIHAASTGTVTTVRCNAVYAATGTGYGCDRDGDPDLTRGCGWYIDIEHPGGVVTRYCHLLAHPNVNEGQQVRAGDIVGVSGSSGHSSGPHLHYEVHLGDHSPATAVDPAPFMAAVGAPLGWF